MKAHAQMISEPNVQDAYVATALIRLEHLLKAAALTWQAQVAVHKPDELWGAPYIGDGEVLELVRLPPLGPLNGTLARGADHHLEAAHSLADQMAETRAAAETSRLVRIEDCFGLGPASRDLLLLALLPELDQRYRRLIGYIIDDASQSWPSCEFAIRILAPLYENSRLHIELGCSAPLRRHGLLVLDPSSGDRRHGPMAQRAIRIAPAVLGWLRDGNAIDTELLPNIRPNYTQPNARPADSCFRDRLDAVGCLAKEHEGLIINLVGPSAADPWPAAHLASVACRPLLRINISHRDAGALREMVRTSLFAAKLLDAIIVFDGLEYVAQTSNEDIHWLPSALSDHRGTVVVASQISMTFAALHPSTTSWSEITVHCPLPTYDIRRQIWAGHLEGMQLENGVDDNDLARELADRFQLTDVQVEAALARATTEARLADPHRPQLRRSDLFAACRAAATWRLGGLAKLISPEGNLDLDDLVLPATTRARLHDLLERLRQRRRLATVAGFADRLLLGHGTIALFAGGAGTGKTMAAMLLGRALGADLLKADLSMLVDKYVGETEKHLERLFAEAEAANAVLFFDEADSLFGKRGEVKEARDRWANLETNYLLQRIEEFDGIVILATNLRQNLDEAFARRIDMVIDFPFPDAVLRTRLWRSLIPDGVRPPNDEALSLLGETFPLAGGNIKAIVVDATCRAAAEQDEPLPKPLPLELRHLVISTAREYEKLGKPISPKEFGTKWYRWIQEAEELPQGPTVRPENSH